MQRRENNEFVLRSSRTNSWEERERISQISSKSKLRRKHLKREQRNSGRSKVQYIPKFIFRMDGAVSGRKTWNWRVESPREENEKLRAKQDEMLASLGKIFIWISFMAVYPKRYTWRKWRQSFDSWTVQDIETALCYLLWGNQI